MRIFVLVSFKKETKSSFCHWGPWPDEVAQKDINLPWLRRHPKKLKSKISQLKKIRSTSLPASSEALNSSPAQSAGEEWPNMLAPFCAKILAHVERAGLSHFCARMFGKFLVSTDYSNTTHPCCALQISVLRSCFRTQPKLLYFASHVSYYGRFSTAKWWQR